jgi:hypothetical protein
VNGNANCFHCQGLHLPVEYSSGMSQDPASDRSDVVLQRYADGPNVGFYEEQRTFGFIGQLMRPVNNAISSAASQATGGIRRVWAQLARPFQSWRPVNITPSGLPALQAAAPASSDEPVASAYKNDVLVAYGVAGAISRPGIRPGVISMHDIIP